MSLSVDFHFIFALLLALNCLVDSESQHFCKSFRQNGGQISYYFRRIFSKDTGPNTDHDIIINGHYWRILYADERGPKLRFLNIDESEESPFFSDNYSMATKLWFKYKEKENNYALLFSKKNWKAVEVGEIPGDDYKDEKPLTDYKELFSTSISGDIGIDFTPKFIISEANNLIFIKQSSGSFNCFVFEMSYDKKFKGKSKPNFPKMEAIERLTPKYEVILIAPQWGHSSYASGYLFLFKDGLQIKWCWSRAINLDTKSCNESPELLVDCSSDEWVPSTTEISEPEQEPIIPIWLLVGFLVMLVVIVIFLIAFMLWFICSKLNQTEDPSSVSQEVSKVSMPSTFSKNFNLSVKKSKK